MATPSLPADNHQTWQLYVGTILHEAALVTGKKPIEGSSDILRCFDVKIRPLLPFYVNSADFSSLEVSAHPEKGFRAQNHWTNQIKRFFTKIIHQQVTFAAQALNQTIEYENSAYSLQSYHLKTLPPTAFIHNSINELIGKVKNLDEMRKTEATRYAIAVRVAFIAAAAWAAGVFAQVQWVIPVGKVGLVTAAVLYAGNWVFRGSDQKSVQKAYHEIGVSANQILHQLHSCYDDKMKLKPISEEIYKAPYEGFAKEYTPLSLTKDECSRLVYGSLSATP